MSTPQRMNPEIKARWIAALKSGNYRKGQEVLVYTVKKEHDHGVEYYDHYCCLGVLCELAREEGIVKREGGEYNGFYDFLPAIVSDWAGIEPHDSNTPGLGWSENIQVKLASKNDATDTFDEVIKIIEAEL